MQARAIIRATAFTMVMVCSTPAGASIVAEWNSAALAEVRASKLGPPMVARALAIAHTCMYDAWAAYDATAVGTVLRLRRPPDERTDANKAQAIGFAAYRCLVNLFPAGTARLTDVMVAFGYDPADDSVDVTTPAGVGNVAAEAVIEARRDDGANQYGDRHPGAYSDYTGYVPRNLPMDFCTPLVAECPPLQVDDPDHWQPLVSEQGVTQTFVGAHWERVRPFALTSADQFDDLIVAPAPDIFRNPGHYRKNVEEILKYSKDLDAARKLIVEYWADGPASELPPGHWGLFGGPVSEAGRGGPRRRRPGPADREHPGREMDAVQPRQQLDAAVPGVLLGAFDLFARERRSAHALHRQRSLRVLRRDSRELRPRRARDPARPDHDPVRDLRRRREPGRPVAPVRWHPFRRRQRLRTSHRGADRPAGMGEGAGIFRWDGAVTELC
jgi:hypothetical protein